MYFTLKSLLRTLLLPPSGPLLAIIIGVLLMRRRPRLGGSLLALGVASLWLLSTISVGHALKHLAEHFPALDLSKPTDAQAIVIIGGGGERMAAPEYRGPAPQYGLLERLSYGAFVARRTGLPIVLSGAPQEGVVMAASLARDFAVKVRCVENRSEDTFENAHFTARMLLPIGVKRIILVTSSTQMQRAVHEFENVGFEVMAAPEGLSVPLEHTFWAYVPTWQGLMLSSNAVYELVGEPWRWLQTTMGWREKFDASALQERQSCAL